MAGAHSSQNVQRSAARASQQWQLPWKPGVHVPIGQLSQLLRPGCPA